MSLKYKFKNPDGILQWHESLRESHASESRQYGGLKQTCFEMPNSAYSEPL